MIVMERRRKKWAAETSKRLKGRRRHTPDESPPPQRPAATTPSADDHATPEDVAAYRRVSQSPRDRIAEQTYQRLVRIALDSASLQQGIYMRGPVAPGDTWYETEIELIVSPLALPQETITARQFAAEWALLYGEAMAWASKQVEPRDVILDDDHEFVKEITGNLPSQIVSRWCNAILAGKGNRRGYDDAEFRHGFY